MPMIQTKSVSNRSLFHHLNLPIDIDYDNEGKFKKTRLVTENEAMTNALSMFKIGNNSLLKANASSSKDKENIGFSIGQKTT